MDIRDRLLREIEDAAMRASQSATAPYIVQSIDGLFVLGMEYGDLETADRYRLFPMHGRLNDAKFFDINEAVILAEHWNKNLTPDEMARRAFVSAIHYRDALRQFTATCTNIVSLLDKRMS